jgi:high-affinity nickel-transport protein
MNLGQLPITCGLFFSLGHSTIVLFFIIAIAISSDVYDRAGGFSNVGGIIG